LEFGPQVNMFRFRLVKPINEPLRKIMLN